MNSLPKPTEPLVVTTVFTDKDGVEKYKSIPVEELLTGSIEETIWLLWTGKKPSKIQAELAKKIIILTADHGPAVAGAYATILATSAGLPLPQAVASGVQMIGPKFGGAAGLAAKNFVAKVGANDTKLYPGFGHKVFSKSKPDVRVKELIDFAKKNLKSTPNLDFALEIQEELLKKNEKLILNIDGAIGAILLDLEFPIEGIDGFFTLARTIGFIAHYIDQKERGTGLIRLPSNLVFYKSSTDGQK